MAKTLTLDCVKSYPNGEIFLQMKLINSDGDACGVREVQFLPGSDVDAVIAAANESLNVDGLSIPIDSHDAIKAVAKATWAPETITSVTAEVVAATQAQRDAEAQHAQAIKDAAEREAVANIAKTKAEAAEALAKEATDKATQAKIEAEAAAQAQIDAINAATQKINDALAKQAAAEEAQRKKIEFDAAVAQKAAELVAAQPLIESTQPV